ncbi:hypothetical protein [Photobacterium leiognathi]|uniref:hypothetical protein n=1 Tax=Photobacterium leiognathi TaxID=553611 RepID=UPI00298183AD|nr:hypothetical protein [Photobacterium leiognathi]
MEKFSNHQLDKLFSSTFERYGFDKDDAINYVPLFLLHELSQTENKKAFITVANSLIEISVNEQAFSFNEVKRSVKKLHCAIVSDYQNLEQRLQLFSALLHKSLIEKNIFNTIIDAGKFGEVVFHSKPPKELLH